MPVDHLTATDCDAAAHAKAKIESILSHLNPSHVADELDQGKKRNDKVGGMLVERRIVRKADL